MIEIVKRKINMTDELRSKIKWDSKNKEEKRIAGIYFVLVQKTKLVKVLV